ncbi:gibberellin-regulated protein 12-like [Trifolium pratense]|uniref:gibberellin-regulated protein 12-like n=1 Tax=Trifolium pratense TaxID=57577 RepID=UPI001E6917E1|nr:gibberellin-regulated protein 12-like [Trifolium pratense]
MARFVYAFFLMLVITFVIQDVYGGGEGSLRPEQCAGACDYRCSKTQYHKACITYCNICCEKCLCVPSGTYGHKEECPCYDHWKTKRGTPKCP